MRLARTVSILLAIATLSACGYFMAGKWEDDPLNWHRAFGQPMPEDVKLLHSSYERFPHWTHEHKCFLMFTAPSAFVARLVASYKLVPVPKGLKRAQIRGHESKVPEWFMPYPAEAYQVWLDSGSAAHTVLLVDRETGVVFFSHFQL